MQIYIYMFYSNMTFNTIQAKHYSLTFLNKTYCDIK